MTPPEEPSPLERLRRLEAGEGAPSAERRAGDPATRGAAPGHTGARRGIVGGAVALLLLALTKGKLLLFFLLTKGKLLLATFATMGGSLWFYAQFYTWRFALGFVVLILVHEMGHGFAARRMGLKVGAPIFIPGFGAVIALKEQPRSTWVSAVVGYGGPLAGALGALAVFGYGRATAGAWGMGLPGGLAHFTFLLNLFNLVPVGGLDGDRITEPLRPRHWAAGLVALGALAGLLVARGRSSADGPNPALVFVVAILLLGAFKAVREVRRLRAAERGEGGRLVDRVVGRRAAYVEETGVSAGQRRLAAAAYFGLVVGLVALALASELPPR